MNRADRLPNEFSSDGVEYRTLGELGTLYGGLSGKSKADFSDGNAHFLPYVNVFRNEVADLNDVFPVTVGGDERQNRLAMGDVLFTSSSENGDDVGMSSVVMAEPEAPLYLNSFCFGFRATEPDTYLPEFARHLFRSPAVRRQIVRTASGVTRFNVSKSRFLEVRVPLPPIKVQREIAKVLDEFTELELELEHHLQAELTARARQLRFYRETLLDFEEQEDVTWLPLLDVAAIGTGSRNTNEAIAHGKYPLFVRSQEPLASDTYEFDEAAIITAGDGVGVGKIFHFIEGKYSLHQRAYRISPRSPAIRPKFLYHFVREDFGRYLTMTAVHASVTSLRRPMFEKYSIPIPSLVDQDRLVRVLDELDSLDIDLTIRLSAELAARRIQHGFYRDRLLTFAEVVA
ncbi:type I restriction enzyme S subunit [Frondihabitans sp. PhB188]|uniref:restriction endonuclease subunit S n=1 Tax=Frondihabitans sp. PhB188 TaxID=2485200 RepID=UPI000F4A1981|nr:restriction endonuclease subunit S [Frondihabitans sp. PhB188]ROQ40688.1 type I restriction enzyme S subunit [Frondihabitans sp. PhB188]